MTVEQRYSVQDFEHFLARPENQDRLFELVHGEIVEKLPTERHGEIAANLITELKLYVRQRGQGRVTTEARHRPADDDHNDRLPDVALTLNPQAPAVVQGAALFIPDLATQIDMKIKSPSDTYTMLRDKAAFYIANGARMVWLIYTEKRLVEVYDAQMHSVILDEDDVIEGGDVLPGFTLPVRRIFEG